MLPPTLTDDETTLAPMAKNSKKRTSGKNAQQRANAANTTQVRLIAGDWRGRVLNFPQADGLRPTGNRIRETLFNWLMPYLPGAHCLDAFSGSGALGFEALSRGAKHTVMLEPNPSAHDQLQNNAQLLLPDPTVRKARYTLFASRAEQFLSAPANSPFDIVFIDPPFDLDLWPKVMLQLEQNGWLNENALIYIETPKGYTLNHPMHWQLQRSKQAGNVTFALYQRHAHQ